MNGLFPSRREWRTAIRYGIILLVLAFFVFNAGAVAGGLTPFILAFAMSLVVEPVVVFLATRIRLGRGWSSLLVLLVLILAGSLLLTWATTVLVSEIAHFLEVFPSYKRTVLQFIEEITNRVTQVYLSLPPDAVKLISENASRLGETIERLLTLAGKAVLGLLTTLPGLVTAGLLFLIATFFMSKDLPEIKAFLWRLVPQEDQNRVQSVIRDLLGVAWRYLRAQGVLIAITTVVTTLGLLLLGIENWFAAGLTIGLLDLLPVIGPTVVFVPWIAYLLIVGNATLAISLLVLYAVAGGTRSLIEAKVIGDSVGLHPLATLLAMYTGALLWGIKGALLGPVIFLVAKAILKAWQTVETPK